MVGQAVYYLRGHVVTDRPSMATFLTGFDWYVPTRHDRWDDQGDMTDHDVGCTRGLDRTVPAPVAPAVRRVDQRGGRLGGQRFVPASGLVIEVESTHDGSVQLALLMVE